MKKILVIPMYIILSNNLMAKEVWSSTLFWRTPKIESLNSTFSFKDSKNGLKHLKKDCEYFENSLSELDSIKEDLVQLEKSRVFTLKGIGTNSTTVFELKKIISQNDMTKEAAVIDKKNNMPFSNQYLTNTEIFVLKDSYIDLIPIPGKKSLAFLMQKIGLPKAEIKLANVGFDTLISIKHLDLACDILNGNVGLVLVAFANQKIPEDHLKQLSSFYHQIVEPVFASVLYKDNLTASEKAVLMGVRLGKSLFKNGGLTESEVEEQVVNITSSIMHLNTANEWVPDPNLLRFWPSTKEVSIGVTPGIELPNFPTYLTLKM